MAKKTHEAFDETTSIFDGPKGTALRQQIITLIRNAVPAGERKDNLLVVAMVRNNGIEVGIDGCTCAACKLRIIDGIVGHVVESSFDRDTPDSNPAVH